MSDDLVRSGDVLARRYRLASRLATGGMSAIWRGVDERLEREVAIKLPVALPGEKPSDPEHLRLEARATARIDHPGAVAVYDYGETITSGGRVLPFTVMPLLDGDLLAVRLSAGRLPWRDAVRIAAEVAGVLAAAHEQGVVHQDVSSENVLLTRHGPRLLDFGIAATAGERDERTRHLGTPPYVAPERLAGEPAQPASDVYALGVLLYEMLSGRRPYPGTTWAEVEAHAGADPPPRPGGGPRLPAAVATVCQQCLSAAASRRPAAAQVAVELRAALADDSPPGRRARRAWLCAAACTVGLVAAALVALSVLEVSEPTGAEPDARSIVAVEPRMPPDAAEPQATGSGTSQAASPDPGGLPADRLDALEGFRETLQRGVATGAVRADVSLDLGQLAGNLVFGGEDPSRQLADLRRKLDDRLREGGLTRDVHDRLLAELRALLAASQ